MTDKERLQDYRENVNVINEANPSIGAFVCNMLDPHFIENEALCPTAQVAQDLILDEVIYEWNPKFYDGLTAKQRRFVILHETMHVLLKHIKKQSNQELWNQACDIVINDMLHYSTKFSKVCVMPNDLFSGENTLGYPCHTLSAEEVYHRLKQQQISAGKADEDGEDGEEGTGGKQKGEPVGGGKALDSHANWEALEELVADLDISYDSATETVSQGRGTQAGNVDELIVRREKKLSLKELVRHIVGKKYDENLRENWRRSGPKMISVYPEIILPYEFVAEKKGGRLLLLFCIDTSGSIPSSAIGEFLSIARFHQRDFDVVALTFDTQCRQHDLKSDKVYGRGGTSFQSVVQFVNKNYHGPEEPDVVFVLTDGWGGTINPKQIKPERWFWIITPYGSKVSPTYGKSFHIGKDITERE